MLLHDTACFACIQLFNYVFYRVDDKLRVKIGDFGLSRNIHYKDYYQLTHAHTAKVPVKWLAMESLFDHIFNEKTDVVRCMVSFLIYNTWPDGHAFHLIAQWSFGVVCWEVFSLGMQPYCAVENCNIPEYLNSGQRMKKPELCPEDVWVITEGLMRVDGNCFWSIAHCSYRKTVLKCWSASPDDRPSFSECVMLLQQQLNEAVIVCEKWLIQSSL